MNNTGSKHRALLNFFRTYPKTALAFSGGTDSAYLLYAASKSSAVVGVSARRSFSISFSM